MIANLLTSWGSVYANHAVLRTVIVFFHVGPLIAGAGIAIASDRHVLTAADDEHARRTLLEMLETSHRLIFAALVAIFASGLLLFAADYETYLYSRVFWIKMVFFAALLANGALLRTRERLVRAGDARAWRHLRVTAMSSIALWLLTTLGGVALPNIG